MSSSNSSGNRAAIDWQVLTSDVARSIRHRTDHGSGHTLRRRRSAPRRSGCEGNADALIIRALLFGPFVQLSRKPGSISAAGTLADTPYAIRPCLQSRRPGHGRTRLGSRRRIHSCRNALTGTERWTAPCPRRDRFDLRLHRKPGRNRPAAGRTHRRRRRGKPVRLSGGSARAVLADRAETVDRIGERTEGREGPAGPHAEEEERHRRAQSRGQG